MGNRADAGEAPHQATSWRNPVDALNRVSSEVLAEAGIRSAPRLDPGSHPIEFIDFDAEHLRAVERKHEEERDHADPPTVLTLCGRNFAIDGTKRINFAVKRSLGRSVIVISVR
ncbi:MAG TPA: hypothetical protein VIF14_13665 [Alphaproteobacteria bacterium]|jgi:hypothetical protein